MRRAKRQQLGLTLIELIVAIAVLAMIVLIVNQLVAQAVFTVRATQEMLQVTAQGRAFADHARTDLGSACKDGFVAILASPTDGQPICGSWPPGAMNSPPDVPTSWPPGDNLTFTSVAPFRSMMQYFGDYQLSNSARVTYGVLASGLWTHSPNWNSFTWGGELNVMRRLVMLELDTGGDTAYDFTRDAMGLHHHWMRGASDYLLQRYKTYNLNQWDWLFPGIAVPPGNANGRAFVNNNQVCWWPVVNPPANTNAREFDQFFQFLAPCGAWPPARTLEYPVFTVEWTDGGVTNGRLNWYGGRRPRDAGWQGKNQLSQNGGNDCPEFQLALPSPYSGTAYCALWSPQRRDTWPKAIKIRYSLGLGQSRQIFEVIAGVPR